MQKGKVIFLNGVSSAGKTTLAKTLQSRLNEDYYWFNVDLFISCSSANPWEQDPMVSYRDGKNILMLYPDFIKRFSDSGINVIADAGLMEPRLLATEALKKCIQVLHEYPLLYVHVTCPLEELRRREKERGGISIGKSESMFVKLNPHELYDITVDTFKNSINECADIIIELLDYQEKFTAFKTLWSKY
ncbi:MAG: chloramphenicol phosphotransferase CPT family protein [Oscillospiraceae bacterium]|nr:chloramphenicol phosphotransferase CPT family protein [Oscillospiraceae bacterium]